MNPGDTLSRVLYVDLSRREFRLADRPELFDQWLGGTGAGIRLLQEECPTGADPLSPENPIVLSVGPTTSLLPMASKTVACFKSPHTGNLGESHAGGRSAVAIRLAGYGAIVVRGTSETPIYLAIHGDDVCFRDAGALWGMGSCFTVGRIIREREPGAGARTIMRIGRAGERGVSYASVTTETYRHFGRLGLGAAFGSKNLKAIVVSGRRSVPVSDGKQYRKVYEEIFQTTTQSEAMQKYHELGTAVNILPLNELGALPTRNLQAGRLDGAEAISGESLAEQYLGRRVACAHCPVGCIHLAAVREAYEDEPYFYKTEMISYDYELLYALGSMLGITEAPGVLRLIHTVEGLALDAMTVGVVLAWATEAAERGLIPEAELAGAKLGWGDWAAYGRAVRCIVEQPTNFYRALARGVEHAAGIYGGEEFALAWGGLEMAGYHTGPAAHLGYLTGARHSHLDGAGYSIDQKSLRGKEPLTAEQTAEALFHEEAWRQVLSSLVVCFFARGIYTPETVLKALELSGMPFGTEEELRALGARILAEKHAFKAREGFRLEAARLPGRIAKTPAPAGQLTGDFMQRACERYRQLLGASATPQGGGQ